jgi:hypothetical protein
MARDVSALVFFFIVVVVPCRAEVYQGVGPLATFADVKTLFPQATIERLQPAWAQPEDVLYALSGAGISGTIIVKFYDGRPAYRRRLIIETDDARRRMYEELASNTDDAALSVEWVRWIPFEPVPLKRFVSKYGEADSSGFRDDNMVPFRQWSRGILANLDDDSKNVLNVEFSFTEAEERAAWKQKYNFVPEYLEGPSTVQDQKLKPMPRHK